ncbi:metalloprotease [Flavobacterium sp.]|uniref:metalloprotease n=1 Tax=Flavobacterium sp. TaxID=239 RepID=UPI00286AED5F|nr:metalloprotease [Flavobacterium sp.]
MKSTKKIGFAFATLALGMLFSCSNEETQIATPENLAVEQPSALNKECGFVDNNWASAASLYTTLPNSGSTTGSSLITTQNSTIASFWGRSAPTFRFVRDLTTPSSTFNAISYSTGKIYFGEAIFKWAYNRDSSNLINVMILAHEYGHQLQYAFGLPSVSESTARPNELEADGFSGYYLRRGYGKSTFASIATAYDAAFAIGDNNVNSPGHHGTPAQRRSAVRLGFLLADPGNAKLSASSFDSNFFYYYAGVLNGTYRQAKPQDFDLKMDTMIKLHAEELRRIASGEMSDQEYLNLQ